MVGIIDEEYPSGTSDSYDEEIILEGPEADLSRIQYHQKEDYEGGIPLMPIRMEISYVGEVNKDEPKELDAEKRDERITESECGKFYDASDEFQSD